jgi:hypothetical protein
LIIFVVIRGLTFLVGRIAGALSIRRRLLAVRFRVANAAGVGEEALLVAPLLPNFAGGYVKHSSHQLLSVNVACG